MMRIRAPEAPRGVRLRKAGLRCLQSPSRGEGRLASRACWGHDLPGRVWGKIANIGQRVQRSCGYSDS
eukprot:5160287-Alexandrium_andersonii.AAC.1